MRAILALVGLIALVVVALMMFGMLRLDQQQGATLPKLSISGGSLPKYKAETGSVGIGTTNASVQVPTVEMKNATVTLPQIQVKPAAAPSPTPAAQ